MHVMTAAVSIISEKRKMRTWSMWMSRYKKGSQNSYQASCDFLGFGDCVLRVEVDGAGSGLGVW